MHFPESLGSVSPIPSSPSIPLPDPGLLVRCRLERSACSALRRVCCEYREGVLRLRGCLPSHHLKQVALATVVEVEGIRKVVNEIEVVSPPANSEAAQRFAWDG